jgi:zeta-carotene desaturase
LQQSRVVTQLESVFSVTPESNALRPAQASGIPGLSLAGDWTDTGWPATMESAVRSGYLAAESALSAVSQSATFLVADLPRSWLLSFVC